ncbi:MAG: DUF4974 domain-containing protein [Chitinophagaceae bacterium]|nr:MAG: DUF4974 domain-containing protein [Chitinophagaceae bacterium]
MTNSENIGPLLQKYISGTASADETDELFFLLREGNNDDIIEELLAKDVPELEPNEALYDAERWEPILTRILASRKKKQETPVVRIFPWRRIAIAACLFVVAGFAFYNWWPVTNKKGTVASIGSSGITKDIPPGREGAILTLQDGSQVLLDTVADGSAILLNNSTMTKTNGMLSYGNRDGTASGASDTGYNVLTTPRGRQFRLVLPDGTMVYMNAMSSIRYPALFKKEQRTVELTGEAYFEVAKEPSRPFHVKINPGGTDGGTDVEAIGTGFNINAYSDEPAVLTTLVEGVVRLRTGADEKMMQPGQQAETGKPGTGIKVKTVDTEQVLGWKNGYFILDGTRIQPLMRQLTRWYDVEVVYEGVFAGDDFAGEIPRTATLSKALQMLELTDVVQFKMDGTTVTVSPATTRKN